LVKYKICKHFFSETIGTIFFGLDNLQEEVLRTLTMIPEKEVSTYLQVSKHVKT